MKKEIKKWGDSLVIRFSPEEVKINELSAGDFVDLELAKISPSKHLKKMSDNVAARKLTSRIADDLNKPEDKYGKTI